MSGRLVSAFTLVACALGGVSVVSSAETVDPCTPRTLVLAAFPGEIDKLLVETRSAPHATAVTGDHTFVIGTLRGRDVALALTGIGLVNAEATARAAFDLFRCEGEPSLSGVVFSGVAGGRSFIGDVVVPERWTDDDGATWLAVDAGMLAVARDVQGDGTVQLARRVPAGDPACAGIDPSTLQTVEVERRPEILVGGEGKSVDPFGGRAFPCVPGGGDVFGCEPCRSPHGAPDVEGFVSGAQPFGDPQFFLDYFESPPPAATEHDAEDMETAAVARVAAERATPFIGFRAVSDGQGDPLMLPGFPFQFFFYRQLAADNAATVTLAFLERWGS